MSDATIERNRFLSISDPIARGYPVLHFAIGTGTIFKHRPGSSVGIVTDCGLDCPGSNPDGDEIFRPSRPALGATQPPVKWGPSLSQGQSSAVPCC